MGLVTGGAGFIGSHLVDLLLTEGVEVVVVDDLSSGDRDRVSSNARLEIVDIVDRHALDRVMDDVRPDGVFHLGAQSSVTVSVADPVRDCAVNVQGTLNVLEAAGRHGASVVFTSTGGALYGDDAPIPTSEDRTPAPLAPYGASKWAGEAYVGTWSAKSGIPHAVCRLGNVYGPRQSPLGEAGVVAIFSYCLATGRAPQVFGFGRPTRDYVHVHDRLRELLAEDGGCVHAIYTCPHEQGACVCRKPEPGLLLRAQREHNGVDFSAAAVVGDSASDIEAGRRVGARTVLITAEPDVPVVADHGAPSLAAAAELLLG